MYYKTKADVQKRVEEHYQIAEDLGYDIFGVFLQGSYNYGWEMTDEMSDVDTKCLVLPTFKDIALNKKQTSLVHICDNEEHIEIKDFRLFLKCFEKQNMSFVEILFTDYFVVNPKYQEFWDMLIEKREDIARYNIHSAINCICGMAYEKHKALDHRYPSKIEVIDKYGFDGKQFSHILRLSDFLQKYLDGKPYAECLTPDNPKRLLEIKRNKNITYGKAKSESCYIVDEMKTKKDFFKKNTPVVVRASVKNLFDEVSYKLLAKGFGLDIRSGVGK